MNALIVILIIDTVLQLIICHFSLFWLIAFVVRLLFSMRIIGATFKVNHLCIAEAVALAFALLWHMIVHKGHIPWLNLLLFALFSAIACMIMFLDSIFYVYYTDDDDDT